MTKSQNVEVTDEYTRMHSSRMRTVRCSSRLLGVCLPGGGCLTRWVCLSRGTLRTINMTDLNDSQCPLVHAIIAR